MGDIGIKLSQLGYNVKNADDKNLVFSSAWKLLKILDSGVDVPNSSNFTLKTHGLSYIPFVLSFNEYELDGTVVANTSRLGGTLVDSKKYSSMHLVATLARSGGTCLISTLKKIIKHRLLSCNQPPSNQSWLKLILGSSSRYQVMMF